MQRSEINEHDFKGNSPNPVVFSAKFLWLSTTKAASSELRGAMLDVTKQVFHCQQKLQKNSLNAAQSVKPRNTGSASMSISIVVSKLITHIPGGCVKA